VTPSFVVRSSQPGEITAENSNSKQSVFTERIGKELLPVPPRFQKQFGPRKKDCRLYALYLTAFWFRGGVRFKKRRQEYRQRILMPKAPIAQRLLVPVVVQSVMRFSGRIDDTLPVINELSRNPLFFLPYFLL
jgi:hypothetical protein